MLWNKNEEFTLKEECGVFACFGFEDAINLTYNGLHALQHRGQDAAGISWMENGVVKVVKDFGLVDQVFHNVDLSHIHAKHAIGHVRYATTGSQDSSNIHPFVFSHSNRKFALAHNGNISNAPELRRELEERGTVFWGSSDSEIIGHFLVREKGTMVEAIKNVAAKLEGAFSFVFIDENGIYALRDKLGFRPLAIGIKDGKYLIASESSALDVIEAKFVRDVKPGEIIAITKDGLHTDAYAETNEVRLDAMELVYFARPDSVIDGVSVQSFRKQTGKTLATESPSPEAELVIPVPDSSTSAALGYSEVSGIPFEYGLIKNRYIARTFIQPSQTHRTAEVQRKLNASPVIKGKNVVLIDDSIVRGTTLNRIIKMVRDAGAKRVDVRIASPKIIAPSYYGINISTYKELVAHHHKTDEELAKAIGADSVRFLSIEGMKAAAPNLNLEVCIFTDCYPTYVSPELIEEAKK